MIKRILTSLALIAVGILALAIPGFHSYIDTGSFFFDLASFLKDYPAFTYPVGIVLIIAGIVYLSFTIIHTLREKTIFVIQKGDEFGNVDLHFPKLFLGNRDEVFYDSITSSKHHDKSVIEIEKERIKEFYGRIPSGKKIAFLSVSSTPSLVYAGYVVSNSGRKVSFFHWNRDDKKTKILIGKQEKVKLIEDETIKADSTEYVICVSVSYQIDKELVSKDFAGKNIKYLNSNNIGLDAITTKKELDNIANSVRKVIGELPNCRTQVHLLLLCPSYLCFAIGQRLNSPVLPSIKVYSLGNKEDKSSGWSWCIELNQKQNND